MTKTERLDAIMKAYNENNPKYNGTDSEITDYILDHKTDNEKENDLNE